MRRAVAVLILLAGGLAAPGADAGPNPILNLPLPWQSPPFTTFVPGMVTTDGSGDILALTQAGASSTYIAAVNPQTNTPAPAVGNGTGFVGITLPGSARPLAMFVQGPKVFVVGSVPAGTFVQGFDPADGSSPAGPTVFDKPSGTSFTASAGTTSPGPGGSTDVAITGVDTVSQTRMLFTANVAGGVASPGGICPTGFNPLTSGASGFAPSTVGVNGARQIIVGGISVSGLLQRPAAAAVNAQCNGITVTPLSQPNGATNDGFPDAVAPLPNGNFLFGSDISAPTGAVLQFNLVQPNAAAAAGTSPLQGALAGSAAVTSVFPFGTGFAAVGSETPTGQIAHGVAYAYDATGNPLGGFPQTFADRAGAAVVPQIASPFSSGLYVAGIGSPDTGPNTLDVWRIGEATSCTPSLRLVKGVGHEDAWVGGVRVTRTVTAERVAMGGLMHFELTLTAGDCPVDGVSLHDVLPGGVRASSAQVIQEGRVRSTKLSGDDITIEIAHIAPLTSVKVFLYAIPTGLGEFHNTASVTTAGGGSDTSNDTTLTVVDAPGVASARADARRASGTAVTHTRLRTSADAAGGVPAGAIAHVDIAVVRMGAHKTCRWLARAGRLTKVRTGCNAIQWLRARGTARWHYTFKRRLDRGSYFLLVRPVARSGIALETFLKGYHNLVAFRVR